MTEQHLSEEEIQQYADNEQLLSKELLAHIHNCESCRQQVEMYRMLFTQRESTESKQFDFDLAGLVLEQVSRPYDTFPGTKLVFGLAISIGIILTGTTAYLLRANFTVLFEGLSSMTWLLAIAGVSILTVILGLDTYSRYQKRIRQIDLL